jgi:p-hydroxybenzoate 3-monooxygenase
MHLKQGREPKSYPSTDTDNGSRLVRRAKEKSRRCASSLRLRVIKNGRNLPIWVTPITLGQRLGAFHSRGGRKGIDVKTQVGIIGAGPAGLMLSRILHLAGIESVVLEKGNRDHVGTRLRAGGLEHGTVDLMKRVGLGQRMEKLGIVVNSTDFRFNNAGHRVHFAEEAGHTFLIYPQYEIIGDLLNARTAKQADVLFNSPATRVEGIDGTAPVIHYESQGEPRTLTCEFVAGCDGYHGVSRNTIPASVLKLYEEIYPFSWLGILADVAPPTPEVAYSCHERGFAMNSFRTPEVSRMYLQCANEDRTEDWSDDRIWSELRTRLDVPDRPPVTEGAITQKSITAMRNFVAEPMSYGRLYIAGDAAHIVPPTGAKGLNSAMSDVAVLGRALTDHYAKGNDDLLKQYSDICLKRTWKVQHFSAGMCTSLHIFPNTGPFGCQLQRVHLEYLTGTPNGRRWYAENFVGLPFDA